MFRRIHEDTGQTMTEYGVTLGVIAVTTVGLFALLGDQIAETFAAVVELFI